MIIFILIVLLAGAVGGWQAHKRWANKIMVEEQYYLRSHVNNLKQTVDYWKEQSAYNKDVGNSTIQNHNTNLSQTLNSIISLLQNQNKEAMKEGEKEQVENIIKTIKGL